MFAHMTHLPLNLFEELAVMFCALSQVVCGDAHVPLAKRRVQFRTLIDTFLLRPVVCLDR